MMKVAFISVFGDGIRCGIASYNSALIKELEKFCRVKVFAEKTGEKSTDKVSYCWQREKWPQFELIDEVNKYQPDIVFFSHEFGVFSYLGAFQFTSLVSYFKYKKYKVFALFHSVYENHDDKTVHASCVPNIIVHTERAKLALIKKGIDGKHINVITHGIDFFTENKTLLKPLWNTWNTKTIYQVGYNFFYKGFPRMMSILAKVKKKHPDVHYIGQLSETSKCGEEHEKSYREVMKKVEELKLIHNVSINRGFASMDVVLSHIRTCNVVVYPYLQHPDHSVCAATGAGRIPLMTETPIVVSDVNIFDDLKDIVLVGKNDDEICQHICDVFDGKFNYEESNKRRIQFIEETCWKQAAFKLYTLFKNSVN